MGLKYDHDRLEFLGIEIIFTGEDDPRGSIWIEFSEVLSLLYGKNGSGKSTILTAITAFLDGKSLKDTGLIVQGYVRLLDPLRTCSIIEQSIKSMPNTGFLNEWDDLETTEINDKYNSMRDAINLPHPRWESSLFSAVPDSVEDLEMNWEKFVSHFLFLGLWDRDFQYNLNEIDWFAQHLIEERLFCIQPSDKVQSEWNVTLAANLSDTRVREEYEYLIQNPSHSFFDEVNDHYVSQIFVDYGILSSRSDIPRTNSPYVATTRIAHQTITSLGISVVDLNEELDINEWTKRRISELVYSEWFTVDDPWFSNVPNRLTPTSLFTTTNNSEIVNDDEYMVDSHSEDEGEVIWSATFASREIPTGRTIEFEMLSDRVPILQATLTFVAKELPEELAISDLRITVEDDLGLWIFDSPGQLEAFDRRSGSWIPVKNTSSATQKIIGMALKIHSEIRSSEQVVVAVGDEIDQGLHVLAINGLYKMLADSIPTCFIATHSPIALASKVGDRIHVHRGALGEILVTGIESSDFSSSITSNFGVRVSDLIGTIDLAVAVEGLHDKLVIEHFLKTDDRFTGSNILIISMTGVNNATNLVDADFLLSYTDLRIVAVADNTSKSDLESTRQEIIQQLATGRSPGKLSKALRARAEELRRQRWHEQRCMVDLLALATDRGLLSRLKMSGHIYADIEMALNPVFFGLDKDWLELEAEFKQYRAEESSKGQNFKDFIRSVYEISIDRNSISMALSMTTEIPEGMRQVLDDIAVSAFQADLFELHN